MTAAPDADAGAWHDEAHVDVQVTHQSRNAEFAAFMAASVDPLHRTAYLLCGDRHRAEELVQQALERTYRSWHRAREGDPLAYARRTLANLRIDTWRSTRREVLADHDGLTAAAGRTDGPDGTHAVDDRDAVVRALLLLPLRQRRVVVLRHLVGLSEEEVSRELGIPRGTVKSTASRGLSRLRAALDLDALGGPR